MSDIFPSTRTVRHRTPELKGLPDLRLPDLDSPASSLLVQLEIVFLFVVPKRPCHVLLSERCPVTHAVSPPAGRAGKTTEQDCGVV